MILKNRNIFSKIRRSKDTDYAALIGVFFFVDKVLEIVKSVLNVEDNAEDGQQHSSRYPNDLKR